MLALLPTPLATKGQLHVKKWKTIIPNLLQLLLALLPPQWPFQCYTSVAMLQYLLSSLCCYWPCYSNLFSQHHWHCFGYDARNRGCYCLNMQHYWLWEMMIMMMIMMMMLLMLLMQMTTLNIKLSRTLTHKLKQLAIVMIVLIVTATLQLTNTITVAQSQCQCHGNAHDCAAVPIFANILPCCSHSTTKHCQSLTSYTHQAFRSSYMERLADLRRDLGPLREPVFCAKLYTKFAH